MPKAEPLRLAEHSVVLAERVVAAHYRLNPALEKAYGPRGRKKCVDDALIHLAYLEQAVAHDSERLYLEYVLWAKTLFEGIKLPVAHLIEHLSVMRTTLATVLASDEARATSRILAAASDALNDNLPPQRSFLVESNPLQDLARDYLDDLLAARRQAACARIEAAAQSDARRVQDIYLNVFQPCQREIGRLWQTGRLSVAQEHFCTAVTQLCMAQLYPLIFRDAKTGPKAVITCAQGELHEVGVRMVADLLEMNGWDAYYLGANVPVASVVDFVVEQEPRLLGVSATITTHLAEVKDLIDRVKAAGGVACPKILVGGYPFNIDPTLWRQLGADGCAADAGDAIVLAQSLVGGSEAR